MRLNTYYKIMWASQQLELMYCRPEYSWKWWGIVFFNRDTTPPKPDHVKLDINEVQLKMWDKFDKEVIQPMALMEWQKGVVKKLIDWR